MEVTNNYHS